MRRRWLLTILLLSVVVLAIGAFLWQRGLRDAPLQLATGEDTNTPSAQATGATTPEPSLDDAITQGPPPRALTFVSDRDGPWDIFTLAPDGTLTNLTADGSGANDYFVSWAMDASQLNFLTDRHGDALGPAQMQADGSELSTLDVVNAIISTFAAGRLDWDPAWSPEGERLLWSSVRDLGLELYIIDIDAEFTLDNATRLTNNALTVRDWFGTWSPDGEHIVYASTRDGNENLYRYDIASGDTLQLTDHPADDIHGMYTLDGEQIIFVSERDQRLSTGVVALYTMNPDGSEQRPLPEATVLRFDPIWLPNGTLAYTSNEDGPWHLYVRTPDGQTRRVTDGDANHLFPVWQP